MKYPKGIVTSNEEESEDIIEFSPDELVSGIKPNIDRNWDYFSAISSNRILLEIRRSINPTSFSNKAFFLNSFYDWVIVRDQNDILILVPIVKKGD